MAKEIIIDAKNKKLGRIASETAKALRGKTSVGFLPHSLDLPKVIVKNADSIAFSEKKLKDREFWTYSGYPGGRKVKSAWEVAQTNKRDVLRRAVSGMLRKNRLKKLMIKNLIIYHGEDK
ncbi:50S ribosomal protein L13 [Candidatus Giovannonibacteria bacterium RIFCSPHIGHO2_01_FULL_45_24]|uniref:Large ribosomal subunit protein uL13 n=1 Tax=Candidatus Giovannonibacteria bacterium RIFCSPLOWO2_01_FULL_46_32 TaxID=1798353 RepID=A0A1F5XGG0_9BACT|nr:MAG: 50S ribosomal protein L13 [Candidatus Giovannonibacteria bacterium RIFCSPHIGHO2_01_FULL_45_24]OGF86950.1 MAG: 50S ribosomal protein L13 [Candidatus Giovannonibacteria bacterium RIFCSPLOWO2_01_FULL_46_32]